MLFYSFDVFDTVITRDTATPKGIFALMQERLLTDPAFGDIDGYIRRNFFHLRVQAELLAKSTYLGNGIEDIMLEQIYEALGMTGLLAEEERRRLRKLEIQIELESSRGIPEGIRQVRKRLEEGNRVAFLSNMYLDETTVRRLLHKADPALDEIPLYVSSERKKIKNTGSLYRYVRECEGVEYSRWVHTGDNKRVDVEIPEALGIRGIWRPFEKLLPWERDLIKSHEEDAFCQLALGASRNARLKGFQGRSEEGRSRSAYEIGSSVGGCVLFPYVWWVLGESRKKGIRRLYFMSRDGYVLKQIADRIIERNGWQMETCYLYGSREAFRMPAVIRRKISVKQLIAWSHPSRIRSFRSLARAAGIEEGELLAILGLPAQGKQRSLSMTGLYNAVLLLRESEFYWRLTEKKYERKRERAVSYLQQEIDTKERDIAFVEVSGSGFTQYCLADLLSEIGLPSVSAFYYKLDRIPEYPGCIFYNFIPGKMPVPLVIELLTRAPHGQTVDYERKEGRFRPVLKPGEEEAFRAYGLTDYMAGVLDFTDQYLDAVHGHSQEAEDLSVLMPYIQAMCDTEYPQLTDFLGDMPDTVTGWEAQPQAFGPRLSAAEKDRLNRIGREEFLKSYRGSCLEYSLLRCTEEERVRMEQALKTYKKPEEQKSPGGGPYRYGATVRFPCELLGGRVVLYGAGKAGRDLYRRLTSETDCRVTLWVDREWKCRKEINGFPISPVEEIRQAEYDQVIVTVLDREAAKGIKEALAALGIKRERILAMDYHVNWQED